uniref:Uncharacterized protein n=1 Tax=Arion vulgaris TaxID=1028688 RepID=A0A0B7AFZ7_9EUPU
MELLQSLNAIYEDISQEIREHIYGHVRTAMKIFQTEIEKPAPKFLPCLLFTVSMLYPTESGPPTHFSS